MCIVSIVIQLLINLLLFRLTINHEQIFRIMAL